MFRRITLLFFFSLTCLLAFGQKTATVYGRIIDAATSEPIELVTVYVEGGSGGNTDQKGNYAVKVPIDTRVTLRFRRIGYKESTTDVLPLSEGARFALDIEMAPSESNLEVVIRERRLDDGGMIKEKNMEAMKVLPTSTGNLESILPHIALGTSSGAGGELTSQYQVRGGNYDENLVYVNDFEIYRPQLIRAGQQEGLTFPNINLIQSLSFSSGGFQAKYGDKLSSVLDIKYKRPDSLRTSLEGSLLGGSAHIEGSVKKKDDNYQALRYMVGARYKTTKLLLGSLDVEGEYTPNFADIQAYITYDLNDDWQLGLLGNYNRSEYEYVPQSLSRAFGLIDFALQIRSAFEGQEVDDFTQGMGGISLTFLPDRERNPIYHKFMASAYRSQENERFDILGHYILGEIDSNLGSDNFGEIVNVLGTGTQHIWVRNYLTLDVRNSEYRGGIELQNDNQERGLTRSHFLQWSVKWQNETILDKINEWERLDSALYSIPYDTTILQVQKCIENSQRTFEQSLLCFHPGYLDLAAGRQA